MPLDLSYYSLKVNTIAALTLSQELGIPLVKDCEELLVKIQEELDPPSPPLQSRAVSYSERVSR
jgi:hypothetical protein